MFMLGFLKVWERERAGAVDAESVKGCFWIFEPVDVVGDTGADDDIHVIDFRWRMSIEEGKNWKGKGMKNVDLRRRGNWKPRACLKHFPKTLF